DPVVVDLCAGSGALALAVADELPAVRIYAVEQAPHAVDWLRRNVEAEPRITPVAADVGDAALLSDLSGRVDAVLSNPPYVPATAGTSVPAAGDARRVWVQRRPRLAVGVQAPSWGAGSTPGSPVPVRLAETVPQRQLTPVVRM